MKKRDTDGLEKLFKNIVNDIKKTNVPDSYWKKEDKLLKQRIEKNKKVRELLRISVDKFKNSLYRI